MSETKQCYGCGRKIIRQYFTMVTPHTEEEVVICPKCMKVWKHVNEGAKDNNIKAEGE